MLPRILSLFATLACLFALTGCDHTASATNTGADGKPSIGTLEKVWGRRGISDGRFQKPRAMAIDKQDRLYIVDMTARIQVFDADGNFLRSWQTPVHENGRPTGLSIDRAGNLAVADTHYFEVLFYTPEGELLKDKTFGPDHGPGPGQFGLVTDVAEDSQGNYFVSEYGELDRVQKFTHDGKFILQWGEHGEEPGQFSRPQGLAIDDQDRVWVADSANNRIQVFDNQGKLLFTWGEKGTELGQLMAPYNLILDGEGHVYVCELGNSRVQKFTLDGKSLGAWGSAGANPGELDRPWALARDSKGRINILDTENHRVQRVNVIFAFQIAFDSPGWLWLLAVLPVLWWFSLRSLSGLGPVRRWVVLLLRSVVLALIVLSLAEIQDVRTSDKMAVIYVLDQSVSIPEAQRQEMAKWVNADINAHMNKARGDYAGVVVFGREAVLEHPPYDDKIQITLDPETRFETDHTNIEEALKLTMASFPKDAARRVVVVTDGNENMGSALPQARQMAESGVGIDVVPIRYTARADVAVERVTIPPDVNRGQPFDVRVVLNNTGVATAENDAVVKGHLEIYRKTADGEKVLAREPVALPPGKTVKSLREEIDSPDFYTYEARFVPDDPAQDPVTVNNKATTFTHVRGQGQVLLIENFEQDARGEFDFLVDRLRKENLQVTVRQSDQLFNSLAELQPFDTVILADVPREDFSQAQIKMLVRNTQQMGSGLVMLGGPNSFGAGGWAGTDVEEAMPVDFQIKNKQVAPIGALAMLMHASEMANGNHWQKVIADAALGTLSGQDYCGVIHWEGTDQWLWTSGGNGIVKIGDEDNRGKMKGRIDRMTPGDMPAFDSTLTKILNDFNRLPPEVAVKHAIVISDGDPSGPAPNILQAFVTAKIKITTVGVGTHGQPEATRLRNIATATGGTYYQPSSPSALPRIYQKEARVVTQPLIFNYEAGFSPQETFPHEMLKGISGTIPPITGYVLTNKKENPLVEIALLAPVGPTASGPENRTILAGWTYGLGKTVALTTDAGKRWASDWTHWDDYDKLFSQIVRWSMRPAGDQGKFTVSTDLADGKVRVTITALDKNDDFLNFLNMGGSVVGPDMKPIDLKISQTAPGRYIGEFDSPESGSYFLMLSPGAGLAPILSGVNVPYSPEYLDRETNEGLIKSLASLPTKGSTHGEIIEDTKSGAAGSVNAPGTLSSGRGQGEGAAAEQTARIKSLLQFDPYRHNLNKASSSQPIWHLLMLVAGCLFFADVFVRRVQINFAWLPPLVGRVRDRVLGRESGPAPVEMLQRLRSRKAAITQQIDQRRAATRFEPTPDAPPPDSETLTGASAGSPISSPGAEKPPTPSKPGMGPQDQPKEDDDYTARLLRAKKEARKDRKDDGAK